MKISLDLLCLVASVFIIQVVESKMDIDQLKSMIKPIKSTCIKKTSIDSETMADIVQYLDKNTSTPDQSFMCFTKCILQMLKIVKNGEINSALLIQQIEILVLEEYIERFKNITFKCQALTSQSEETCEKVYIFIKCFYETDPEVFFF